MLIRLGYDIQFEIGQPVPMVALLSVHPSRRHDLKEPDRVIGGACPKPGRIHGQLWQHLYPDTRAIGNAATHELDDRSRIRGFRTL